MNSPGQQYCLRWNNHRSNLLNVFDHLLQTEAFTDVTLACNGTSIKCHKMVLAACSSYFQSLFLENKCAHPIVLFKDIAYGELRAILEYMYRGEVNVAQEQLPSLLKVAEALKVKGLFEDDSGSESGIPSAGRTPTPIATSHAQSQIQTTTSGQLSAVIPTPRISSTPISSSTSVTAGSQLGGDSAAVTERLADSHPPSNPPTPRPRSQTPSASSPHPPHLSTSAANNNASSSSANVDPRDFLYRPPYNMYKSPLLSPPADQSVPLSMWPPLVMPLHLGAFESALSTLGPREREQALAMYGFHRDRDRDKDRDRDRDSSLPLPSSSGREDSFPSGSASKRKRILESAAGDTPMLRNVLGPHLKSHEMPPLYPLRTSSQGSANDDRTPSGYAALVGYADRYGGRDRDDDWPNADTGEDDPNESMGDYGAFPSSPHSDKRDLSGARIAPYVPTQKLEWKRYKQYTSNDITAAIDAVKGGMSALQASRKFKVPSRTLYDKVKKLGIATTRPYNRASSSNNNASTAAAVAAVAAAAASSSSSANFGHSSAMSLVKRERSSVVVPLLFANQDSPASGSDEGPPPQGRHHASSLSLDKLGLPTGSVTGNGGGENSSYDGGHTGNDYSPPSRSRSSPPGSDKDTSDRDRDRLGSLERSRSPPVSAFPGSLSRMSNSGAGMSYYVSVKEEFKDELSSGATGPNEAVLGGGDSLSNAGST